MSLQHADHFIIDMDRTVNTRKADRTVFAIHQHQGEEKRLKYFWGKVLKSISDGYTRDGDLTVRRGSVEDVTALDELASSVGPLCYRPFDSGLALHFFHSSIVWRTRETLSRHLNPLSGIWLYSG